jgi:hypothetical protein
VILLLDIPLHNHYIDLYSYSNHVQVDFSRWK